MGYDGINSRGSPDGGSCYKQPGQSNIIKEVHVVDMTRLLAARTLSPKLVYLGLYFLRSFASIPGAVSGSNVIL
jgi:hypothetical protein